MFVTRSLANHREHQTAPFPAPQFVVFFKRQLVFIREVAVGKRNFQIIGELFRFINQLFGSPRQPFEQAAAVQVVCV